MNNKMYIDHYFLKPAQTH